MMPKKPPKEKRSYMIGVKVDEETKEKITYLAGQKAEGASTYIYNLLKKHLEEKEPWITREIEALKKEENNASNT